MTIRNTCKFTIFVCVFGTEHPTYPNIQLVFPPESVSEVSDDVWVEAKKLFAEENVNIDELKTQHQ